MISFVSFPIVLTLLLFALPSCSNSRYVPEEKPEKENNFPISSPEREPLPERPLIKKSFQQIDRTQSVEKFELSEITSYSEKMIKADASQVRGKIDILIIVDNSGSMYEEQRNLSTKILPLLSEIEEQDWQINIISTDSPCPTHPNLPFSPKTEDLMTHFAKAITIGTSGHHEEKAMEMTNTHLRGEHKEERCHAAQWLRQGAGLSMIILSDEDEDPASKVGPGTLVQSLRQFGYEPGFNAKVFSIISMPDKPCSTSPQVAKLYHDAAIRTGGFSADICEEDYTEILEQISVSMTDLVISDMPLQRTPDPSSLTVTLNGTEFPPEYWRQEGAQIIFAYAFSPGDTVQVDYRTGYQRHFALKNVPLEGSLEVLINGQVLEADRFRVIHENSFEGTKSLLFINEIPDGSKLIDVSYINNSNLIEDFSFQDFSGDQLKCHLHGQEISFEFSRSQRTIRFSPNPQDGEIVECSFRAARVTKG